MSEITQQLKGEAQVAGNNLFGRLPFPRFRLPIRLKITLPYLFLAVVIALGVASLATRIILENVEERFTNQLYEAGKLASESMVKEEDRLLETLRLLSRTQGVPTALENQDSQTLRELAIGIAINNREEAVEFLDSKGTLVLSMRHKRGGNIEEYEFAQGGTSMVDWEIVRKVLAGETDAHGDKFADRISTGWGDYFYISGPVYDSQRKLVGVVMVGKTLETLASQIRKDTNGQITFYGFDGRPISSTLFAPVDIDPVIVAEVIEIQETGSIRRTAPRRELDISELPYSEILYPWEYRGKADLGVRGVALVANVVVTASLPSRQGIFILIALTVFFIILVGINLATLITRPLMTLVQASRDVATGNLKVRVPHNSGDEIAELAETFNQMVTSINESKEALIEAYDTTLAGWSKALELRDKETQGHTDRVTNMTVELAELLGINGTELANIRRGALLHDIGKMGIPDEILLKEGPLTADEWVVMRRHPQYAYDMLKNIHFLVPALDIPHYHHERWDGSGYPHGTSGEQIPLAARLFAVVDVWDAITSDRPYHKRMSSHEALEIIKEGSGNHFDPRLVDLFLRYVTDPGNGFEV